MPTEKHCTSRCGCWCDTAEEKGRCVYWGKEYPHRDIQEEVNDVCQSSTPTAKE